VLTPTRELDFRIKKVSCISFLLIQIIAENRQKKYNNSGFNHRNAIRYEQLLMKE
jgi:hypothetical protein